MTYGDLEKAINYFEDEKLNSCGDRFMYISAALEALKIVKGAFERSKEV